VLLPATISLSLNNRNAALVEEQQQQLQHRRLDKEQRTSRGWLTHDKNWKDGCK
jgi:hypothetical protein